MAVLSALLALSLAVTIQSITHRNAQSKCQNTVYCPCGNTSKNFTACIEANSSEVEFCEKWSRCKSCQDGLNECLQCEEGFDGPLCSIPKRQRLKSRKKRQLYYRGYGTSPQRPGNRQMQRLYQINPAQQSRAPGYCSNLDSPRLGSIRCISSDYQRTCVGKCLPGYNFENRGSENEITLTCEGGVWSPLNSFPPCKSEGHCDLIVHGAGSFNCTTGMQGTRCDVKCGNQYTVRYYCYPGRTWDPPLPHCVRPKETSEGQLSCRCEYGASCDSAGNCVCPVGRTGTFCEIIVPDKTTCRDPGFISNGFRRQTDGSESNSRRSFEEGESVVFGCQSDEFALQGSSLLTCKDDGTWSSALPKCITTIVIKEVQCPDPGQVVNAERLNTDGSPSLGVQQYRIGQSVVYTCRPGFALQRQSLITCLDTGAWSSRTPYCTRIPPPSPVIRTTTESPGAGLRYCRDLGVDPNGSRQPRVPPNRRGFPQGSIVEYSCNEGYDLMGDSSIFCLTSGMWSADRPMCEEIYRAPSDTSYDIGEAYCLNPGPYITNGQLVYYINHGGDEPERDSLDPELPEGSRLHYSCNRGYFLHGSATLICESSGMWSADTPSCLRNSPTPTPPQRIKYCPNPGSISNGRVKYTPSLNERRPTRRPVDASDDMEEEYPQGSLLKYSCNSGYSLEGSDTLSCKTSGSWSADPPKCKKVRPTTYCDNPGTLFNGKVTVTSSLVGPRSIRGRLSDDDVDYPEGTELKYTCDEGYQLAGDSSLKCQSTGDWSSNPPTCIGECGRSFTTTSLRIGLNGVKTTAGEWPWVVAISVQTMNTTDIVCGGAVLNTRTVLTAAHCLEVASSFTLYFGKLHRYDKNDDSEVLIGHSTRLIMHPDYSSSIIDSDIGLIMFEPKIRFTERIQPICLPSAASTARNLMTGSTGYVAGWGETEKRRGSDLLLLASIPVLTNEACMESYKIQNVTLQITSNMFCAGHPSGEQSVCSGDSGSPLVFYDTSAKSYVQEGIVSFGPEGQCGLPGRYPIFTKVFPFLPWIHRNIQ